MCTPVTLSPGGGVILVNDVATARCCSVGRVLWREQQRSGVLDGAADAADVDVRPDVLLPGQDPGAAERARLLQGQLLQRVRHAAHALGHQPDRRVAGAHPVTAVRRYAKHDRAHVDPVPVPAQLVAVAEHVRRASLLAGHRLQAGLHRHEHTAEVSRSLLPVLHRLHGPVGLHQSHRHPVRGHATLLRGHKQVRRARSQCNIMYVVLCTLHSTGCFANNAVFSSATSQLNFKRNTFK